MSEKEFFKALGENIKRIRREQNLSLREFALRCEMEKPNIARLESARTYPTVKTLRVIAEQLGVNVGDLFDFEKDL